MRVQEKRKAIPQSLTKSKYSNKITVVDGIKFASKKEAKRYGELKMLEKAKEIFDLELQPEFRIIIEGVLICKYIGDFLYTATNGKEDYTVVEDCKGFKTPVYKLKKKLMLVVHGIEIKEI